MTSTSLGRLVVVLHSDVLVHALHEGSVMSCDTDTNPIVCILNKNRHLTGIGAHRLASSHQGTTLPTPTPCQLPPLPLPLAQTTSSTPSPPSTGPPVNPYLTTPSLNLHLSTPSLNPHLTTPSLNPHLSTPSLNPHLTNHLSTPSLNPHPSTPPPPRPALQSYAGKYVPAIGYRIYIANMDPKTKFKIPLKGIMIGDGFSDPVNVSLPLLDAASPHKCVQ